MEFKSVLAEKPIPFFVKKKKGFGTDRGESVSHEKPKKAVRMISVIIPAHNEQKYIRATLESLENQDYGWYEVVVVANGCSDLTADVARGHCHRLIVLSQKSLGVARNLGARMARGEILLFLDADTLLEPTALSRVAEEFTRDFSAGTIKGRPDVQRLQYKIVYFLKNLTHKTGFHKGSAGVILCWRDHFIQNGGFDEGLEVRENSELIYRLRKFGKYKYINRTAATTSMRRYDQQGWGRIIWLWCKLWMQTHFGDLHHRRYETVR